MDPSTSRTQRPTLGILYPGDMGAAVGTALLQDGYRVVTTLEHRGVRTQERCRQAGMEVLSTLQHVVEAAEVVFSLVPPGSATELAANYLSCKPKGRRIFVDLNSISPGTAEEIARGMSAAGMAFVDGAVHGLADRLRQRSRVYLSGPAAREVARLLGSLPHVEVLGGSPGTASALRMLISGLTKGVNALFVEVSLAARQAGLLDPLLENYRDMYPGVMDIVDRILPTYPHHCRRRGEEMKEAEDMFRHFGMRPCLVAATRELLQEMGNARLSEKFPDRTPGDWTAAAVVEELHATGFLRTNNLPKE